MLTFISTYFLFNHLAGISSSGVGLAMVLELVETEAESILRHIRVRNGKLWHHTRVLHGRLEISLPISQLLHRFLQLLHRSQFLRAVVADARALTSCKD